MNQTHSEARVELLHYCRTAMLAAKEKWQSSDFYIKQTIESIERTYEAEEFNEAGEIVTINLDEVPTSLKGLEHQLINIENEMNNFLIMLNTFESNQLLGMQVKHQMYKKLVNPGRSPHGTIDRSRSPGNAHGTSIDRGRDCLARDSGQRRTRRVGSRGARCSDSASAGSRRGRRGRGDETLPAKGRLPGVSWLGG